MMSTEEFDGYIYHQKSINSKTWDDNAKVAVN